MFFYENPITFSLAILSIIIALAAQGGVKRAYNKYSRIRIVGNMTGAEMARMIVRGLDVSVTMYQGGQMSDHYDPRTNTIALSPEVYNGSTIAAIGIAAHEAGHALQYDAGYAPIKLRNGILPAAQFGSSMAMPLVMIGIFFSSLSFLIDIGIICFAAVLAFQIFTLPVEFNASQRAMKILKNNSYLTPSECKGARAMLRAAAMTYVAAVVTSLLQLLRLILLANRRN